MRFPLSRQHQIHSSTAFKEIVSTGENTLQYAIDLANSQITNFSSAESNIRDANIAVEAANLTKAQVLTPSSVAAWRRPIPLHKLC